MTYIKQISNIDFVVPEVWEGPGGELHLNDLTAAGTPFGQKILSGITSMILAAVPVISSRGWAWPTALTWDFRAPVFTDSQLAVDWKGIGSDRCSATVRRDHDQVVSTGELTYRAVDTAAKLGNRDDGEFTFGRTLFDADVELFSWWSAKSGIPFPTPELGDDVPWPLVVSLAGGLFARLPVSAETPEEAVNRAMEWTFIRPLRVGESLRGYLHPGTERPSSSRPGWSIWQGQCDFFAEGPTEFPIAIYRATAMLYRSPS